MDCPKCGSANIRYNNTIVRQNRAKTRYRCKDCHKTFYNKDERILSMKGEIGYILSREIYKRMLLERHGIIREEKMQVWSAELEDMIEREDLC